MIRYWDASAVVPLLVAEARTAPLEALRSDQSGIVTWWGTVVECASAVARMGREDTIEPAEARRAFARLGEFQQSWAEVEPVEALREQGVRLLRLHSLRAVDALQLAAALVVSRHRPANLEFVCLDRRLASAAEREGFKVIPV